MASECDSRGLGAAHVEVMSELLARLRRRHDIVVEAASELESEFWLVRVRHAALPPGYHGVQEIIVGDDDAPLKFKPSRDT